MSLASTGCDSSVEKVVLFPSPDNKYVLVVVTELQAANDPTPWWTHISLRRPDDELNKIPGNMLKLVGRGEILAEWQDSSKVCIQIPDDINSTKS